MYNILVYIIYWKDTHLQEPDTTDTIYTQLHNNIYIYVCIHTVFFSRFMNFEVLLLLTYFKVPLVNHVIP